MQDIFHRLIQLIKKSRPHKSHFLQYLQTINLLTDQSAEDSSSIYQVSLWKSVRTMIPLLIKMKATVSTLVVAALALLMTTLLFKESPLVVVAASPGPQPHQNVPTPPGLSLSKNVRSSVKAVASGGWKSLRDDGHNPMLILAAPQPNRHVPTPSHKFNLHSPIEESAAGRYATRTPSPHCNVHVPTPGCHLQKSRKEQQLHVLAAPQPNRHVPTPPKQLNVDSSIEESAAGRSATRTPSPRCNVHVPTPGCRNQNSKEEQQLMVNGNAERASGNDINIDIGRGRSDDSVALNSQPIKSVRKLIAF